MEDAVLTAVDLLDPPPSSVILAEPVDLESDELDADALVLGPKELTAAGLKRAERWKADRPAAQVIAVLDGRSVAATVLRAHGIDSWLPGEATVEEIRAMLSGDPASDVLIPGVEGLPALVITIASPTGGCGKTFLSTNLTTHLASSGLKVLLIDLDLQFGEVAAALQIKHPHSIYEAFYDTNGRALPQEALETYFDELVCHYEPGFDAMLAPRDPALADYLTAEDVERLLLLAASKYDVVVVDTPPSLNDVTLTALDRSDVVAVMSTLDVPSLRNLGSLLDVLTQIDIGPDRVRLLLNKVESDIGIDVKQAQDAFQKRFIAELPANKGASRSINTGLVLLKSEPRSPLARALVGAIEAIVPEDVLPRGVDAQKHSSQRTDRLRSLLRPSRTAPGGPA